MKNKFKANIYEAEDNGLRGQRISCNIINDDMTKPPKWFQQWSKSRFEPFVHNVEVRFNSVENRLEKLETKVDTIDNLLHKVIKLNNLRVE